MSLNFNDLFEYRDGELYWQQPKRGRQIDKPVAAGKSYGYKHVMINRKNYLVHRIVWELHHGPVPNGFVIDHVDGDPGNNTINNLRLATISQNSFNSKAHQQRKYKGVSWGTRQKQWVVHIAGKHVCLCRELEDAATVYNFVAAAEYGEFARLNTVNQPWLEQQTKEVPQ